MPLSLKHNCLFIHVPRTGGTSFAEALEFEQSAQALNGVFPISGTAPGAASVLFQLQHISLPADLAVGPS